MSNPLLSSEVVRDCDGDLWIRHANNEHFQCLTSEHLARRTLDELQRDFGPVQRAEWVDV